jgi:hypothetical protein
MNNSRSHGHFTSLLQTDPDGSCTSLPNIPNRIQHVRPFLTIWLWLRFKEQAHQLVLAGYHVHIAWRSTQ